MDGFLDMMGFHMRLDMSRTFLVDLHGFPHSPVRCVYYYCSYCFVLHPTMKLDVILSCVNVKCEWQWKTTLQINN
jgi:hypothetical protein